MDLGKGSSSSRSGLWEGGGAGEGTLSVDSVDNVVHVENSAATERWPAFCRQPLAANWLNLQIRLGLAPRTIDAYGRSLADYLSFCEQDGIDPLSADRGEIARYVHDLAHRPGRGGPNMVAIDSGVGLANATMQLRLVAVRLFYDHLLEEGLRETNPVGRGRYTPGRGFAGHRERGLIPRFTKLPWIPSDEQWRQLLEAARAEPLRNRVMLALAYDAALRREELCSVRTDDVDPSRRTLRIRAETTKSRRERVVPYSATAGELLQAYLGERRTLSRARGLLFLSLSDRNRAAPITLWSWSKIVRRIAVRADVPRFSTHTLRHLCLTDLARAGWELHAIATFAGHRNPATTLQYIHLSGRDLSAKLANGMAQIHAWRVAQMSDAGGDLP
jgi:integrase/recombinase XerD